MRAYKQLIMVLVLICTASCFVPETMAGEKGINQLNEFVGHFSGKGKVFAAESPEKSVGFSNTFAAKLSVSDQYLEINSTSKCAGKAFAVKWMIYYNAKTGKYAAWMFHENGNPYQLEGTYNPSSKTLFLKSLKPYGQYAYIAQQLTLGPNQTFSAKAIFKSNVGQSIIKTCHYSRTK